MAWVVEGARLPHHQYPRLQWYLYPHLVDLGLRFEMPYQGASPASARSSAAACTNPASTGGTASSRIPPAAESSTTSPTSSSTRVISNLGGRDEDFPFWLLTARSMQYSWGGNVSLQMVREVAASVAGHRGVIMNPSAARKPRHRGRRPRRGALAAARDARPRRSAPGHRPDTLLMVGQFDHWITPYAKDFDVPSMNALVPMLMDLTDATGSAADIVPVSIKRIGGAQ